MKRRRARKNGDYNDLDLKAAAERLTEAGMPALRATEIVSTLGMIFEDELTEEYVTELIQNRIDKPINGTENYPPPCSMRAAPRMARIALGLEES